jgi:hypothetical protein
MSITTFVVSWPSLLANLTAHIIMTVTMFAQMAKTQMMGALTGQQVESVALILDICLQTVVHHVKVSFFFVLHWTNFDNLGELVADLLNRIQACKEEARIRVDYSVAYTWGAGNDGQINSIPERLEDEGVFIHEMYRYLDWSYGWWFRSLGVSAEEDITTDQAHRVVTNVRHHAEGSVHRGKCMTAPKCNCSSATARQERTLDCERYGRGWASNTCGNAHVCAPVDRCPAVQLNPCNQLFEQRIYGSLLAPGYVQDFLSQLETGIASVFNVPSQAITVLVSDSWLDGSYGWVRVDYVIEYKWREGDEQIVDKTVPLDDMRNFKNELHREINKAGAAIILTFDQIQGNQSQHRSKRYRDASQEVVAVNVTLDELQILQPHRVITRRCNESHVQEIMSDHDTVELDQCSKSSKLFSLPFVRKTTANVCHAFRCPPGTQGWHDTHGLLLDQEPVLVGTGTPCFDCPVDKVDADLDPGTACTACPVGLYSPVSGATVCQTCGRGKFAWSSVAGGTKCLGCPPGRFADQDANETDPLRKCPICSPGKISSTGATACQVCAPGKFSSWDTTACMGCEEGRYYDGRHGPFSGRYYRASSGTMVDGTISVRGTVLTRDSMLCMRCSSGKHAPYGSESPSASSDGCSSCPNGTFADTTYGVRAAFGAVEVQCTRCDVGTYSASAEAVCHACAAGQYDDDHNSSTPCVECMDGFTSSAGQTRCLRCGDGTIAKSGAPRCTACPADMHACAGESVCHQVSATQPCGVLVHQLDGTVVFPGLASTAESRDLIEQTVDGLAATAWPDVENGYTPWFDRVVVSRAVVLSIPMWLPDNFIESIHMAAADTLYGVTSTYSVTIRFDDLIYSDMDTYGDPSPNIGLSWTIHHDGTDKTGLSVEAGFVFPPQYGTPVESNLELNYQQVDFDIEWNGKKDGRRTNYILRTSNLRTLIEGGEGATVSGDVMGDLPDYITIGTYRIHVVSIQTTHPNPVEGGQKNSSQTRVKTDAIKMDSLCEHIAALASTSVRDVSFSQSRVGYNISATLEAINSAMGGAHSLFDVGMTGPGCASDGAITSTADQGTTGENTTGILDARFADDLMTISVMLGVPTDMNWHSRFILLMAKRNVCAFLFDDRDNAVMAIRFGYPHTCEWSVSADKLVVSVRLGPTATIMPGDRIELRGDVESLFLPGSVEPVTAVQPPNLVPPMAIILAPQDVSYCDSASVSGNMSYGPGAERGFSYKWWANDHMGDLLSSRVPPIALSTFLSVFVNESETPYMFEFGKFDLRPKQRYSITLRVCNFLGVCSSTMHVLHKRDLPIPDLVVDMPHYIVRGAPLVLRASAKSSSCLANVPVDMEWRFDALPSAHIYPSQHSEVLRISPAATALLHEGQSYEVSVWAAFRPGIVEGLGHSYFTEARHSITGEHANVAIA